MWLSTMQSLGILWILHFLSTQLRLVSAVSVVGWWSPRTVLLRDSIYIDGGSKYVGQTFPNWTVKTAYLQTPTYGSLYKLNLTKPFNSTNSSDVLEHLIPAKYDPDLPNLVDGALFANQNGFFTYGGLQSLYRADNQTSFVTSLEVYTDSSIPNNNSTAITTNVSVTPPVHDKPRTWVRCCGADVAVPVEKKGFYFSGMLPSMEMDLMFQYGDYYSTSPNNLSYDMVTCDTSDIKKPSCQSLALPPEVQPRSQSSMVWLPIGEQGALAVIGGMTQPLDLLYNPLNVTIDPKFLTEIPIYDIAKQKWYVQPTKGAPPATQLASFCAVLATAKDRSSYNVYIYGGYSDTYWVGSPGSNTAASHTQSRDSVWVLSMPAFEWINVHDGDPRYRRQNHRCLTPYPNQMLVLGGRLDNTSITTYSDDDKSSSYYSYALGAPFIRIFDMNKLNWTDNYDPAVWSEYSVPKKITEVIGGKSDGGASARISGMEPQLSALFDQKYTKEIPYYFPYKTGTSSSRWEMGMTSWLGAIIGLLGYLLIASLAFGGIVMFRRRMAFQANNIHTPEVQSSSRIISWMHNAPTNPLKGLNLNFGAPEQKSQEEDYLPLKHHANQPWIDDQEDDITSAKASGSHVRNSGSRYEDEEGQYIEMRSFLGPGYPSTVYTP